MKLPQIRMDSQFAKIGIKTNSAKALLQQPQANLDLQSPQAELKIHTMPGQLTIDQSAAWDAMDLKSPAVRTKEWAADGGQDALQGIARRTEEGNELMRIENKGNPLAEQAKRRNIRPEKQFNIGTVPPYFSVKQRYEASKVNIEWTPNKVSNNTRVNKPIVEYIPGSVETSLQQNNWLKIDYVNINF